MKHAYRMLFIMILMSCSHFSNKQYVYIPDQDIARTDSKGQISYFKAGEKIDMNDDAYFIESDGYVSVLIVPLGSRREIKEIKLKKIDSTKLIPSLRKRSDKLTETILSRIVHIQRLMGEGRKDEALQDVKMLRNKYPEISYLKIFEVSTLVYMGKMKAARDLFSQVEDSYEDNVEVQKLKKIFKGI